MFHGSYCFLLFGWISLENSSSILWSSTHVFGARKEFWATWCCFALAYLGLFNESSSFLFLVDDLKFFLVHTFRAFSPSAVSTKGFSVSLSGHLIELSQLFSRKHYGLSDGYISIRHDVTATLMIDLTELICWNIFSFQVFLADESVRDCAVLRDRKSKKMLGCRYPNMCSVLY